MQLRIKILGEEHEDCLYSYADLGLFYWDAKKDYEKAEELLVKAMMVSRKIYGIDSEETEYYVGILEKLRNEISQEKKI